eukprot:1160486-Pelagomonas_calceolata.AAC.8
MQDDPGPLFLCKLTCRMTLAPFSSAHEADNGSNSIGNGVHAQHQQHQRQQHGTYKLTGVLVHQGGSLHSGQERHLCMVAQEKPIFKSVLKNDELIAGCFDLTSTCQVTCSGKCSEPLGSEPLSELHVFAGIE